MKETYSKNYFEKYAALTLIKILHVNEEDIIQDDRPDLRIACLNYGIEVTQALTPQEAIEDVKKQLYTIDSINPFDHNDSDFDFVIEKINHAIIRKLDKSKNYTHYHNNALYIFSHCHNLPKNLLENYFYDHVADNLFFQHIYINCVDHVYHYNCVNKTLTSYSYKLKELISMNIQALEFEKHCHKVRRKIEIPQ